MKGTTQKKKAKSTMSKWPVVAAVVAVLAVIGVLLYFFVFKKDDDESKKTAGGSASAETNPYVSQLEGGICKINLRCAPVLPPQEGTEAPVVPTLITLVQEQADGIQAAMRQVFPTATVALQNGQISIQLPTDVDRGAVYKPLFDAFVQVAGTQNVGLQIYYNPTGGSLDLILVPIDTSGQESFFSNLSGWSLDPQAIDADILIPTSALGTIGCPLSYCLGGA